MLIALPLLYGSAAIRPVLIMAATGLAGLLIYRRLKATLVRERPFIRHPGITLAMPPLDRYSFPSGHTLHAVCYSAQAVAHFPQLAWLLVPAASLIALSRVVLGLHYPTDVCAGAAIGALLALCGLALGETGAMRVLFISDVYFPRVNGVSTSIATFRADLAAA